MAKYTVFTPAVGFDGDSCGIRFVKGVAVVDDAAHPAALNYFRGAGYTVLPVPPVEDAPEQAATDQTGGEGSGPSLPPPTGDRGPELTPTPTVTEAPTVAAEPPVTTEQTVTAGPTADVPPAPAPAKPEPTKKPPARRKPAASEEKTA